MWAYNFMQHALISGILVSTICGIVSVLVVIRRSAFASHALGHMSLTGAAGAIFIGVNPLFGQLILNLIASTIMGIIGDKVKRNDLAVGVVLAFVLGLGSYFLFLFQNNYAGNVISILFGNILAVSTSQIYYLSILFMIVIIILGIFARQLIFASIDPSIANSKNIPIKKLSIVFFIILAITVSMACQIVGALLIFVMLIVPGAIALQWCDSIFKTIILSILVANLSLIFGLYFSFWLNLPVSFFITSSLCSMYLIGFIKNRLF